MSKTIEVTYGLSIMMGEHWEKISVREALEPSDTMEVILDDLNKRLLEWHQKKYPNMYRQGNKPALYPWIVDETDNTLNEVWETVKAKLETILFQEEAQEYANAAGYGLTIEAKKIINSKPLKNKK